MVYFPTYLGGHSTKPKAFDGSQGLKIHTLGNVMHDLVVLFNTPIKIVLLFVSASSIRINLALSCFTIPVPRTLSAAAK
jgi:hypothetical protein